MYHLPIPKFTAIPAINRHSPSPNHQTPKHCFSALRRVTHDHRPLPNNHHGLMHPAWYSVVWIIHDGHIIITMAHNYHGKYGAQRVQNYVLQALYLEDEVPFRLCLGLQWREFPEILYLALSTHAPQKAQVWFRTINN
jgi:hypothetical protein